ncbi:hypothetical protein AYM70_08575 [Listeria monocytogenes]|nr:hypothetical protein [Listeria monocytogenes]EAF8226542.1 hypothetical protein [Listeria monocytogenes]
MRSNTNFLRFGKNLL